MKKLLAVMLGTLFIAAGCAGGGAYNMQKGAVIGAGLGAIAGQAIGQDTEATLIGTGVGALLGSIAGNAEDQRLAQQGYGTPGPVTTEPASGAYLAPVPPPPPPAGRWVVIPGHWEGRRWVPAYRQWRPLPPY